jgi:hypothetical protein
MDRIQRAAQYQRTCRRSVRSVNAAMRAPRSTMPNAIQSPPAESVLLELCEVAERELAEGPTVLQHSLDTASQEVETRLFAKGMPRGGRRPVWLDALINDAARLYRLRIMGAADALTPITRPAETRYEPFAVLICFAQYLFWRQQPHYFSEDALHEQVAAILGVAQADVRGLIETINSRIEAADRSDKSGANGRAFRAQLWAAVAAVKDIFEGRDYQWAWSRSDR